MLCPRDLSVCNFLYDSALVSVLSGEVERGKGGGGRGEGGGGWFVIIAVLL